MCYRKFICVEFNVWMKMIGKENEQDSGIESKLNEIAFKLNNFMHSKQPNKMCTPRQ